ncbi:cytochrome c oxidase subunit II [Crenothrix sp.]|uniref:cytochrome c oxidase subunit II n=1 Tax=Crenothrix sp. TaxID=3100433 RepID=UPI00374D6189
MNKTKQLFASLILTFLSLGTAQAYDYDTNLPKGVTWLSRAVYDLHMQILWICVAVGVAVFGVMFYSIFHHRKSKGHKPAQFYHNTKVEVIWVTIPAIIIVVMGWLATGLMREMYHVEDSDMTVIVTGHQFYWEYKILGKDGDAAKDIHFDSELDVASKNARDDEDIDPLTVPNYLLNVNEPLVIPIHKKIRFVLTAADVIHSWWVPDLGWKKDANPGFTNEAWANIENESWMTGDIETCESVPKERWSEADKEMCATLKAWRNTDKKSWSSNKNSVCHEVWDSIKVAAVYRGQCTELCGAGHGFMPVVVIAMKQADYDKWSETKLNPEKFCKSGNAEVADMTHEELIYKGSLVYSAKCESCHGRDGGGGVGPSLMTSTIVKGDINDLANIVLNGKGPIMPAFAKQPRLAAHELAEVITYVRDRFGNKKDDEIQPSAIKEMLVGEHKNTLTVAPSSEATQKSVDSNAEEKANIKENVDVSAKLTLDELVAKGEGVYASNCLGCHQAHGEGMPPMFPALAGSSVVNGDIDAQINLMLNGKNSMPAFGKTLNALDFAAVLAYTRNNLGNSMGDFKQPSEIQSLIIALPAGAE